MPLERPRNEAQVLTGGAMQLSAVKEKDGLMGRFVMPQLFNFEGLDEPSSHAGSPGLHVCHMWCVCVCVCVCVLCCCCCCVCMCFVVVMVVVVVVYSSSYPLLLLFFLVFAVVLYFVV